ncbi:hypothetical protein GEV29_01655 [Aeromicrobium sp. SMF47]|uniref:Uncharacterized protein n=1 Tax=Aeromicrobium yanjiei TaxID=2662028 RepID=A0A5Q2MGY6_9ACTN|nr:MULTISPECIES: hypothetical protein [Aeromicrobium]MRJ75234.1 hypothetical protein [Aeromicrobium yanjiei]MRK02708.1 hypothetical protein [Aeromicrobium sp. S22]QGG40302.1 hypothetical protein GEV26_02350 [Aeromicrobium yanjiei]
MSSTWQGTAKSYARRLVAERTKALALATAILLVVGVVGLLADEYDLVLFAILLLQGAIAGYLVTAPAQQPGVTTEVRTAVDQSSARTLADLSRARQSILDAIAELDARTK